MFTELHRGEKRKEGDRGGQEDKGGIKRSKSKLASNPFPMCSPQYGSLRDVHGVTQRRGRKETEVARRIKRGIKRRETDNSQQSVP